MLKAVKRKGWAANRAKIPLMDLLCWHIAYKRRKNDSNKASCKIWDEIGVGHAAGIEISKTAVEKLEQQFEVCDNISVYLADITDKKLDLGERFHIINAIGVMFHIVDDEAWSRSITNIVKHLESGGIAIIGGKFDFITRNVDFAKTDEFSSWKQFKDGNSAKNKLLVYKRLRSKRMWCRTLKRNNCTIVDIIPARCRIHTPQNNLLIFRKLSR